MCSWNVASGLQAQSSKPVNGALPRQKTRTIAEGGLDEIAIPYLFTKAPRRHALIIGNERYSTLAPLPSAGVDAARMADSLRALGFNVTLRADVESVRVLEDDILPTFRRAVDPGDLVVVYFSGHGFSHRGSNYLAPTSIQASVRETDLFDAAISIESLEDYFARRSPALTLIIADACRSVAGFVVAAKEPRKDVPKGFVDVARSPADVSSVIAFAARQGSTANGNSAANTPSLFTRHLLERIGARGKEFRMLYRDVEAAVSLEDNEQLPGMFDWSAAEIYLNASPQDSIDEHTAWVAALATRDPKRIGFFARRHGLGPYAAAARKWLADQQRVGATIVQAPRTLYSPEAVERSWQEKGQHYAIMPLTSGFSFERLLNSATLASGLNNRELGLVLDGSIPMIDARGRLESEFASLAAHGTAVTNRSFTARSSPFDTASAVLRVPSGTRLSVEGFSVGSATDAWLQVSLPMVSSPVFLRATSTAAPVPAALGMPSREVFIEPSTRRADLADAAAVSSALRSLRDSGVKVSWVSIASGSTSDTTTSELRLARIAHVASLLKGEGIPGTQITSIGGVPEVKDDRIRLRFFSNE